MKTLLAPVILVLTAFFMEQAWWIRGALGAAVGASLFIAIPAMVEWAKARANAVTLRIDCLPAFLPTKIPDEGRVTVVQLTAPPEVPHQAGKSMLKYGDPGMPTMWPQGSHAYKCEIRNLSSTGLFDVALTLTARFNEATHSDGIYSGEPVRSGDVTIEANRIEEKHPFIFYVTNLSNLYASITGLKVSSNAKGPGVTINQDVFLKQMALPPYGV
jgi:hypothetical protein